MTRRNVLPPSRFWFGPPYTHPASDARNHHPPPQTPPPFPEILGLYQKIISFLYKKVGGPLFLWLRCLLRGLYTSVVCRFHPLPCPDVCATCGIAGECGGRVGGFACGADMGDFPFPPAVRWVRKPVEFYGVGIDGIGRIEGWGFYEVLK